MMSKQIWLRHLSHFIDTKSYVYEVNRRNSLEKLYSRDKIQIFITTHNILSQLNDLEKYNFDIIFIEDPLFIPGGECVLKRLVYNFIWRVEPYLNDDTISGTTTTTKKLFVTCRVIFIKLPKIYQN